MKATEGIIAPGATVRCGGRRAIIGALVKREGQVCALTVAHVLGPRRSRTARLGDSPKRGRVIARIDLHQKCEHWGDVALVGIPASAPVDPSHPLVGPLKGHLIRLSEGQVVGMLSHHSLRIGRVVAVAWNGPVRYPWGKRQLIQQVLVQLEDGTDLNRGDSGNVWLTQDGFVAGLQVGVVRSLAIVTPLAPVLERWGAKILRPSASLVNNHFPLEWRSTVRSFSMIDWPGIWPGSSA